MNVGLFIACFNEALFPRTGQAVVEVLERLGCTVGFPLSQTCCGQLHFNSGYSDQVQPLIKNFVAAFEGYDAIVTPSSSCAKMIRREYTQLGAEFADLELAQQIAEISGRTFEFCEFLIDQLKLETVGAYFPHKVAYHATCSSLRGLGLAERPKRLLNAVSGLQLVDIANAEECCGFGGTFAVKNEAVSSAMLQDKMDAIAASGAEVCTAVDNSCLMHIRGGLERAKSPIKVMHIAEILASQASCA